MTLTRCWMVGATCVALCSAELAAAASDEAARPIVIHAGALLAVPGEAPRKRQSIVIDAGKIVEILDGYIERADAEYIDLRDAFTLPGLIDLHVHLTTTPEPGGELRVVADTAADLALEAAANAEKTLAAGFTTVLDLGTGRRAHEEAIYALRKAAAVGLVSAPRILAVGSPIAPPGSSRTGRYQPAVESVVGPAALCSGADECRRTVREQVRRGADLIAFYNTGSLLSNPSPAQVFTDEEMHAIVETAHALGRKVIADGGNTRGDARGINAALRAGVDSIDTVTYPDAETFRLIRERKAFFVPHLYALRAAVGDTPDTLEQGTMGWLPRSVLEDLYELKQQRPATVQAIAARVRIAFGSDPGVFLHGHNAREFAEYVRLALSPMEAIQTATLNAAAMLGLEREIGRIAPGYSADVIATRASPLVDVRELERVSFVMRGGKVYRRP